MVLVPGTALICVVKLALRCAALAPWIHALSVTEVSGAMAAGAVAGAVAREEATALGAKRSAAARPSVAMQRCRV
jgi:hypothetical protein